MSYKQAAIAAIIAANLLPALATARTTQQVVELVLPFIGLSSVEEGGRYDNGQLKVPPVVTNALRALEARGLVKNVGRGLWVKVEGADAPPPSPIAVAPKPAPAPKPPAPIAVAPAPKPAPKLITEDEEGLAILAADPSLRDFLIATAPCWGDHSQRSPECGGCVLKNDCLSIKKEREAAKAAAKASKDAAAAAAAAEEEARRASRPAWADKAEELFSKNDSAQWDALLSVPCPKKTCPVSGQEFEEGVFIPGGGMVAPIVVDFLRSLHPDKIGHPSNN